MSLALANTTNATAAHTEGGEFQFHQVFALVCFYFYLRHNVMSS